MDSCDVLIVGGGPAGSSCAWALRDSGMRVAILDKQTFPRDKVCGGWITPYVLSALGINPAEYGRDRVLQPITGFVVGQIDSTPPGETRYGRAVSFGIRRREFDHYLLKRSGARLFEGQGLHSLEREGKHWIANAQIRARIVIGAGGHFCPVSRQIAAQPREAPVVAQEIEFELDVLNAANCSVRAETPELYFCSDMKGYGWCFRKGNVLNIGLGRADQRGLPEHVAGFLRFLAASRKLPAAIPPLRGHAYLLQGTSPRPLAGDGYLLIGDAAGLAYPQSGEGILPAVESGLLAGNTILAACGSYRRSDLEPYARQISQRFGGTSGHWATNIARVVPPRLMQLTAQRLINSSWFIRKIVLDRWFLHR